MTIIQGRAVQRFLWIQTCLGSSSAGCSCMSVDFLHVLRLKVQRQAGKRNFDPFREHVLDLTMGQNVWSVQTILGRHQEV